MLFHAKSFIDRGQSAWHSARARLSSMTLGVIGQVTRVFPFTSEVTLLTDKDAMPYPSSGIAHPVCAAWPMAVGQSGRASNCVSWRRNADMSQIGDVLSHISGTRRRLSVGLCPVATVVSRRYTDVSESAFARIALCPAAKCRRFVRHRVGAGYGVGAENGQRGLLLQRRPTQPNSSAS